MKALGQHVLVKRDEKSGSHVVPEEFQDEKNTGLVLSVGKQVELELEENDSVTFNAFAVSVLDEEKNIVVVHQRDLLAKL